MQNAASKATDRNVKGRNKVPKVSRTDKKKGSASKPQANPANSAHHG
ncbi:hypothetical protein [Archangium primigenium]|nr:hypothetical protein [Archangium primigenium]MBM7119402.1 hypothetical protein [Archangium primigenium]